MDSPLVRLTLEQSKEFDCPIRNEHDVATLKNGFWLANKNPGYPLTWDRDLAKHSHGPKVTAIRAKIRRMIKNKIITPDEYLEIRTEPRLGKGFHLTDLAIIRLIGELGDEIAADGINDWIQMIIENRIEEIYNSNIFKT